MYRIAVYGKGGVGKSTVAANLSYLLSSKGTVLHVGCDPKHDSTRLLTGGKVVRTFFSDVSADPVHPGDGGVMCVECGGAEPGRGCAGKGMELLFSRIGGIDADYRVCDVLGDVVCGGFSIPARASNCDAVLIVTSGEFMSLFAANNILRGLANVNPGPCVTGLVLDRTGCDGEAEAVRAFSEAVGAPVVCDVPRSGLFREAEVAGSVLCRLFPDSREAEALKGLADLVASRPPGHRPRALPEEAMGDLAAGRPVRAGGTRPRARPCSFDSFDSERNLTYVGETAMPACTSHGAVDAAMRISDAAAIVHGPRNCAYLMEHAFERRVLNGRSERSGPVPDPGVYSTGLDAEGAFRDDGSGVEEAVLRAKADGYRTMFLIPTCTSEIIGSDLEAQAARASEAHGVEVVPVEADELFLASKFGGTYGMFDALISRMGPRKVERGTVNLVARWFYGFGRDANMAEIEWILSLMGLRVGARLLDFCSLADLSDFCAGEYDVQMGRARLNSRFAERICEATGRRRALTLDPPAGLRGCLEWVRGLSEYAPELSPRAPGAEDALKKRFEDGIAPVRKVTEGRTAAVYCVMARDLEWQVETLRAMGMGISGIVFAEGRVIDHNVRTPDYGDVPVREGCLRDLDSMDFDVVVTNDPDRVGRTGRRWAPLASRDLGVGGAVRWAKEVADCLRVPPGDWEAGL